jgi:hypothetical protein
VKTFGKYRSGFVYADSAKEVAIRVACSASCSTGAVILIYMSPEGLLLRIAGDELAELCSRARPGGGEKAPAVARAMASAMKRAI